jgi:hypothetical protein
MIRALVSLVLVRNAAANRRAFLNRDRYRRGLPNYLITPTDRALVLDDLPLSAAYITVRLHLLENARREHMFLYYHASPPTFMTRVDLPIRTAAPLTVLADLLLLNGELGISAIVEIPQRELEPDFHIRAPPLSTRMAEVPATTEET